MNNIQFKEIRPEKLFVGASSFVNSLISKFMDATRYKFSVVKPEKKTYVVRGQTITDDDLNEARAILFSEISNRNSEKQKLEAQTILNTVLNRMEQRKKEGNPFSMTQILQEENQYQGFGGIQYNRYKSGSLNDLDTQKIKAIDEVIEQLKQDSLINNIGNRVRYTHNKKGEIYTNIEGYRSGFQID